MGSSSVIVLFSVVIALCSADLIKAKYGLTPVFSQSSIPLAVLSDPSVGFAVTQSFYSGALYSAYVSDSCVISGWEHGPAPSAGLFTTIMMHEQVGDSLVEKARIFAGAGEATPNVAISTAAGRSVVVRSVRLGTSYFAQSYTFDAATCTFNSVPVGTLDFSTLHPNFFGSVRTYNGGVGFSDDGKYLLYILTLSDDGVTGSSSLYGLLSVSADGSALLPAVQWAAPVPTGGGLYYPQPNAQVRLDRSGDYYHAILCNDNFFPGDPYATTVDSEVTSYRVNVDSQIVQQTGMVPLPQFCQGHDLSDDLKDLYIVTNNIGIFGKSADQIPRSPYPNGAEQPQSELLKFHYDKRALNNALSFVDGSSTDCFGLQALLSHDEKTLFVSCTDEIIRLSPVPGIGYLPLFGAGKIQSYKISGDHLDLQDATPAPPLALNLAASFDDNYLLYIGQPTLNKADIGLIRVNKTK